MINPFVYLSFGIFISLGIWYIIMCWKEDCL